MAYEEIPLDPKEVGGAFFKFNAIGDRLAGRFLSMSHEPSKYGEQSVYKFKVSATEEVKLGCNAFLEKQLAKANLKLNDKVIITYTSDHDTGQASPMKCFKTQVERYTASAGGAPASKPAPAPAKSADPFDDIPA